MRVRNVKFRIFIVSGTDDGAFRNTFFASETHIRDVALMRYLGGDKEVLIVGSRGHSNALHQLAGPAGPPEEWNVYDYY